MMNAVRMIVVGAALALVACGGPMKYNIASTSRAPGADARIVADVKKDQNVTQLQVAVANLAPPGRVVDGAQHFVAWYRPNGSSPWSRVASMKYDEGARKAELSGSVPAIEFDFEVSAEKDAAVASPSADIVLTQRVGS